MTRLQRLVLAKLAVEGLAITSPRDDIERVLSATVAPTLCIATARQLREGGQQ